MVGADASKHAQRIYVCMYHSFNVMFDGTDDGQCKDEVAWKNDNKEKLQEWELYVGVDREG